MNWQETEVKKVSAKTWELSGDPVHIGIEIIVNDLEPLVFYIKKGIKIAEFAANLEGCAYQLRVGPTNVD